MKTRILNVCMAAALAVMATGCSSDGPEDGMPLRKYDEPSWQDTPYRSITMDAGTRAVAGRTGGFSFDFFREAMKLTDGNSAVSPASMAIAMAMVANGDSDESRDDVLRLLGFNPVGCDISQLNDYCRIMLTELPKLDGRTVCRFANSLWHRPGLKVTESFSGVLGNVYSSDEIAIDPNGEKGMRNINRWVGNYTGGMIPEFLKWPLNNTDIFLINATYFKGRWATEFNVEASRDGDFRNLDGSVSKATFMHADRRFGYAKTDRTEAISLPFGSGNFELTALLPTQETGFREFLRSVSYGEFKALAELMRSGQPAHIALSFPKFQTETESDGDMTEVMKGLGLRDAFIRGFNAMVEGQDALINGILQAVNIKVDEKGVEAAAATGIGMATSPGPDQSEVVELNFDRPFLYVIRETSTGTILFMGMVTGF